MNNPIAISKKIYANRSLNFQNIAMIGFDMDHTLASYHKVNFETLAFRLTVEKFIEAGYPEDLRKITFDPNFIIRGLLIDKERGNLLKVDTHKYVKIAYHGHQQLTKEERRKYYNRHSYKAEYFGSVDTFFSLSEFHLFVEIIDFKRKYPEKIQKSYREIYDDLREFIDLSHKDGTIKNLVIQDPSKYLDRDENLSQTLIKLRQWGKKIFLLTNSLYDYTNSIMSYLLHNAHPDFPSWKDYFDIIIVGAGKPGFFTDSQPFLEVVESMNLLKISDGHLKKGVVYHGGNAKLFQKITRHQGDEILYVGDHIYGDIIRSKDSVNWRTLLVLEELDEQLQKLSLTKDLLLDIYKKIDQKEYLDEQLQLLDPIEDSALWQKKEKQILDLQDEISKMISRRSEIFHPLWGDLMKVGLERSRFANQIASSACLYTSKVTNLRFYGAKKKFISFREKLPHENIETERSLSI